jgi:hypothetical protein
VKDAWWSGVQAALVAVATGLVMGWLAKARLREHPATGKGQLIHPKATLVIGLVPMVLFLGIAVISNTVGKNGSTTIWTTLVFIALAALGVPLVSDYYFARHRLLDDGMTYGGMFGQRGHFRWSEVAHVRYGAVAKWFVLELSSGKKVRISAMLRGLPEFAAAVLAHVPRHVIDQASYDVLRDTAAGNPPSIWQ